MKVVKLTLPIDVCAKSLFKNTVGNDLGVLHECKFVTMISKNSVDTFIKNGIKKV